MKLLRHSLFIVLIFGLFINVAQSQDATAASIYNEGLELLKSKDYQTGLEKMLMAIEMADPEADEKVITLAKKNGSVAAGNLGNTSYKAKDYVSALQYYAQGVEMNPESTSCAIGKARALNKQDKPVEALLAYIAAGDLYSASEDAEKAEKSYTQAQNIVGKLYVDDEFDEALAAGEAYLNVQDNAEVRYYMSRSLIETSENEMALDHISKAIEMAKATGEVEDKYFMAQGISLENLGRKSEAISAYEQISGAKYKAQAEYRISQLKA